MLVVLLFAPTAAAESVQGGFTTSGSVVFGAGTQATAAHLSAFVAPDLSLGASLSFADPAATYVCLVTYHELGADAMIQKVFVNEPGNPTFDCEWRHNVNLTAIPGRDDEHAGYVGLYPTRMSTTIQSDAGFAATPDLAPRVASRTAQTAARDDPQAQPGYSLAVPGAQLVVEAPARETLTGSGMMKLRGMNAHLTSTEGARDYFTGANTTVGGQTTTWLLLNFSRAQATIQTGAPALMAVDGLDATTPSGVSFHAIHGDLTSADATFSSPSSDDDQINGQLALTFSPNADATGALHMSGEIHSYNLQRVAVPVSSFRAHVPTWAWPAGLSAVAAVLTSGATAIVVHRRRVAIHLDSLRYYRYYAEAAEDEEDFDVAASWLAPALDLDPANTDLLRQQMLYLRHAGDIDGAIEIGERTARLTPKHEGTVDFYVAAIYMEAHDPAFQAQARIHLERALEKDPSLALSIQKDRLFKPLHDRDFQAMIQEALARARERAALGQHER